MIESANIQIGERLRIFREAKKLTQAQMAEVLGGTARGVQNTELNISLPNSKLLIGLHGIGLNVNWLLSGEGPMLLTDLGAAGDVGNVGAADLKAYGECLEILELALNKLNRRLSPEKKRIAVDSMYRAWKREKKIDPQLLEMITQLAA